LGANLRDNSGTIVASNAVWSADGKTLKVSGRLRLDYCPVRLDATIDANSFEGRGKLTVIDDFVISTSSTPARAPAAAAAAPAPAPATGSSASSSSASSSSSSTSHH
jgi:hypothetical protein